ncbi:hypothetical protein SSCH_1370003 [Syntrophaceticus schinkii]|uniref:Uncharacterized protein n=1 Tax=Syntrophaceticus schinkii TaxID=499207 RepID=A0A0B7MBR0_9FIRM|nr:hypothetical protein SSCH_1370003 [Syntrophaceticus schinkii]
MLRTSYCYYIAIRGNIYMKIKSKMCHKESIDKKLKELKKTLTNTERFRITHYTLAGTSDNP